MAFAGQVPGGGLWLATVYSFITTATPDSLFAVDLLVLLLEGVLLAGCVGFGSWLVINRDRGLGWGLIIGWGLSVTAVVLGTALISAAVP